MEMGRFFFDGLGSLIFSYILKLTVKCTPHVLSICGSTWDAGELYLVYNTIDLDYIISATIHLLKVWNRLQKSEPEEK